jgi:hypothetical protein
MAHECPECGQVCYCGGDIDDVLLDDEDAAEQCVHFEQPECDGYREFMGIEDEDE